MDYWMSWLYNLPIQVAFRHHSEEDLNTKIWKSSSKLYLIVSKAAVITRKGRDNNLSKKWYDSEHESGCTIQFAVHAHALYYGGFIKRWIRSVLLFKLVNMVSGIVLSIWWISSVVDIIII